MSSLPTELVAEILHLTLPSPPSSRFDSDTYQGRVSLLSSFSLASHAFNQIAEPLLYATFWARNKRQFDAFIEAVEAKQNAHLVHQLVLDGSRGGIPQTRVLKAAETLTSVTELSLYMLSLGNLNKLDGFHKLESLVLEDVSHGERTVFTLPSLRDLTVGRYCSIELSCITDENAPQLSALALRRRTNVNEWYPTFSSTTPWNLDAFLLEWYHSYRSDQRFPNVLANIALHHVRYAWQHSPIITCGVVHFRLCDYSEEPMDTSDIDTLIAFVRLKSAALHRLETLILPLQFEPDFCSDQEVREKLKTLSDECVANGVDLIYEEGSDGKFNSDVSKAFVEKMQRLARARQQVEASKAEEEENKNDR
ncbi:uncharacterized protein JCM6883_007320 [Sporobolomyces salmoneus]|uniref:uncharacterized protein n=1 Tax=Sporobolomyces salmoneus TaxID=183962 RepID=UPI0031827A23